MNSGSTEQTGLLDREDPSSEMDPRIADKFKKVNILRRWVTVEPAMFLYFMAFTPLIPLGEQFVMSQVAQQWHVHVNKSNSICDSKVSTHDSLLEKEIQAEASKWMILMNACMILPGVFVTALIGSYSDHMGRKIGMISPIVGSFLRCCVSVVVIAFDLPFLLLSVGLLIDGFSGGIALVISSGFSSLADICPIKDRALRIMVVEISIGMGIVAGQFGAGLLLQIIGFEYTYGICALIQAINFLYVMFCVIETRIKDQEVKFFTLTHYIRMWKLISKDDEHKRRWKLWAALVTLALAQCVEIGSQDNITYYQMARPLCFSSVLIGYWQALSYGARFTTGLIMVKLLADKWGDHGLMFLGIVSGILLYILLAFSKTRVMIFHAIMVGMFFSLVTPMVRSISSKAVSADDQGVVFSIIATIQASCMLVGSSIFNAIYAATVSIYLGFVFFVQAGVLLCAATLSLYFIIRLKREKSAARMKTLA